MMASRTAAIFAGFRRPPNVTPKTCLVPSILTTSPIFKSENRSTTKSCHRVLVSRKWRSVLEYDGLGFEPVQVRVLPLPPPNPQGFAPIFL